MTLALRPPAIMRACRAIPFVIRFATICAHKPPVKLSGLCANIPDPDSPLTLLSIEEPDIAELHLVLHDQTHLPISYALVDDDSLVTSPEEFYRCFDRICSIEKVSRILPKPVPVYRFKVSRKTVPAQLYYLPEAILL